jgi:hypothetical protein
MVQEIRENLDRVERMEEPLFDEYFTGTYTKTICFASHMYGDDVYVAVSMELYESLPNIVGLRCTVNRWGVCGHTISCIRGSKNNIEKGVAILDKMIIANIKQIKDIDF